MSFFLNPDNGWVEPCYMGDIYRGAFKQINEVLRDHHLIEGCAHCGAQDVGGKPASCRHNLCPNRKLAHG